MSKIMFWLRAVIESVVEGHRMIEDRRIADFRNGRRSPIYYY